MKCVMCCVGETTHKTVSVDLRRGAVGLTVDVTAEACDACNEYYVDQATTERLLKALNAAVGAMAEGQ